MNKEQEFVTRRIGGETIIVPLTGGVGNLRSIFTLNESGAAIWQMLRASLPLPEIAAAVCREYEVSAEKAAEDIRDFMADLRNSGLLDKSSAAGV